MNSNDNVRRASGRRRPSLFRALIALSLLGFGLGGCDESDTSSSATASPTSSPVINNTADRQYAYGTKLMFGAAGNAGPYKLAGWNAPEAEGTWTDGNTATLSFKVPPSNGQIIFKATLAGFIKPPELPSQPVNVLLNGKQVTHWEIGGKGLVQMAIPGEYLREGELRIDFIMPSAASPKSLGVSIDERRLGMCFYDLALVKP
jgi:hypothetical protein